MRGEYRFSVFPSRWKNGKKVFQKAVDLAEKNNRTVVTEKDLVDAFFAETPFGFHGPMKNDMESLQIDYLKYGYPK